MNRRWTVVGMLCASAALSGVMAGAGVNYGASLYADGIVWRGIDVNDPDRPQNALWLDFIRLGQQRARGVDPVERLDILPVGDYYPVARVDGMGFEIIVPRAFARPGDRWVELFLEWDAGLDGSEALELEVALYPVGGVVAVEQRRFAVEEWQGQLLIDLRRHGLEQGRVVVELIANGERRAVGEVFIAARPGFNSYILADGVRVDVDEADGLPADQRLPVTFGIPFGAGSLWDASGLVLVDARGREVPGQFEVVGRWAPDGAIKWVRVDALPVPRDGLFVTNSRPAEPVKGAMPTLKVENNGDRVIVDTGDVRYELGTGTSPIISIWRSGRQVASADGRRGLYVIDQNGRVGRSSADGQVMTVESSGPVAACIRFEGNYRTEEGEELARHITRVELFAGRSEAKVTHTLILSRDSNEVWFRDIGWEFAVEPGSSPEAFFGVDWEDRMAALNQSLAPPVRSVHSLQAEHLRFGSGDNRFIVAAESMDGTETLLLEGAEVGDWALLRGDAGGLFAAVRDAALQHPKEFELTADSLTIRLFSDRAGEELDFRAATLVDKWNLPEYFGDEQIPIRATVAAIESNAIGWAKTHELMLAPVSVVDDAAIAPHLAILNADKVYGHVDPWWIYSSKAMGPLYPKDAEANPELEAMVDNLVEIFSNHLRGSSFFGFVDYNAGPSFTPRGSSGDLTRERRFLTTYQLRPELWGVYARSGERGARAFTEQTNRAWADNKIAHWSGPGKTRGLFMEGRHASPPLPHLGTGDLPFYWQDGTVFNVQDATNLNQIIHDYFLTGNRRAGDIIHQYVDGMIEAWDPVAVARRKRKTESFWAMAQAYGATHDAELRPIAEATASFVYDPEGSTAFTSAKELGATYKARTSVRALIDGWEIFGTPPYFDMAMRMGEHKWLRYLGRSPVGGTTSPFGVVGNFLLRETGSLHYAKWLEIALRRAPLESVSASPFRASFITSGIPAALDALAGTTAAELRRVSWAAWQDGDGERPVSVVVSKGVYDNVDVFIQTVDPGAARRGEWVRPLTPPTLRSRDRSLIVQSSTSNLQPSAHGHVAARVNIPKDSPGEDYEIIPLHPGVQWIAARLTRPTIIHDQPRGRGWTQPYDDIGYVQMVLHAPAGWLSAATPARVFFKVPRDVQGARVHFSEPTPLFGPDGEPFGDGEPVSGWVDLPTGSPGLWSFQLDGSPREIHVDGIPPYYAFDDARTFFVPE